MLTLAHPTQLEITGPGALSGKVHVGHHLDQFFEMLHGGQLDRLPVEQGQAGIELQRGGQTVAGHDDFLENRPGLEFICGFGREQRPR